MNPLAQLVDEAMKRKGYGYNRLSVEIGILDGRIVQPTQLRRLRLGQWRNPPQVVVQRLIEILDMPWVETWWASGQIPPGMDFETFKLLVEAQPSSDGDGPNSPRSPNGRRPMFLPPRRRHTDRPLTPAGASSNGTYAMESTAAEEAQAGTPGDASDQGIDSSRYNSGFTLAVLRRRLLSPRSVLPVAS